MPKLWEYEIYQPWHYFISNKVKTWTLCTLSGVYSLQTNVTLSFINNISSEFKDSEKTAPRVGRFLSTMWCNQNY